MFKERQFKGLRFAGFERFRATGVKGVMISCDVRSETMCQSEVGIPPKNPLADFTPSPPSLPTLPLPSGNGDEVLRANPKLFLCLMTGHACQLFARRRPLIA